MFKDPIANQAANEQAARMIDRKTKEVSGKVTDPNHSDAEFMGNLFDLCTLNKMADSHRRGSE